VGEIIRELSDGPGILPLRMESGPHHRADAAVFYFDPIVAMPLSFYQFSPGGHA